MPAAVAFHSLLRNANPNVFYEMFVLHSDIGDENQHLLQDIIKRTNNATLTFVNTDGFLSDAWQSGNWDGHQTRNQFTSDALLRCFAARFFPQYDKIIYSDVDIVVTGDISEIYDIDLTGKYIAGVKNAFLKFSENELSHLKPEHYEMLKDSYIAGGIWVMNLKQIRADNLEQRMLEIVNDNTIVKRWNDQDIVNIACENRVAHIPLNYISYPYLLGALLLSDNCVSHFSIEELYDSILRPKIVHYAYLKPWKDSQCKKSEIWWEYYYYLGLDKIFPICPTNTSYETKKIKKYKTLYNVFLILSVCLLLINFTQFLIGE